MATHYTIGVSANRFELFDLDDVDPLELIHQHEIEREKKRKAKTIEKRVGSALSGQNPAKEPKKKVKEGNETATKPKFAKEDKLIKEQKSVKEEKIVEQPTPKMQEIEEKVEEPRAPSRGFFRARTFQRGGGRFIGKRDGPTNARPPRGPSASNGAHNKAEKYQPQEEHPPKVQFEEPDHPPLFDNSSQPDPPTQEDLLEDLPDNQEPQRELTLDEWRALKGPRQKPTYNIRKPGEGEDQTQWKKMYELRKKNEEDEDYYEYLNLDIPQRVGRQKHLLDLNIHYRDARGGGRGRGRGGFRPPQDNHSKTFRDETSNKAAPKVDDEHDFPSLG